MTKIVVFGSYSGGSIGDTAILLGLISSMVRVLGPDLRIEVLVARPFDLNSELRDLSLDVEVIQTPIFREHSGKQGRWESISGKAQKALARLRGRAAINEKAVLGSFVGADLLIIGGGNLIMDLYRKWPLLMGRVCELASLVGLSYGFLGVGAAPINSVSGAKHLKQAVDGAEFVYFRDDESKRFCERELGLRSGKTCADLVFGIDDGSISVEKRNWLLVNVASVYSSRWPEVDESSFYKYVDDMAALVASAVAGSHFDRVVVFNTNYPLDDLGAVEFVSRLSEYISPDLIAYERGSRRVSELLSLCREGRVSIVTRLHAGLISCLGGVPVFGVAYQPKVRDVFSKTGCVHRVVPIGEIGQVNVQRCIDELEEEVSLARKEKQEVRWMVDETVREVLLRR